MNDGGTNTRHDGEEPIAPAKLVAALKEPSARRVFVPPAVDDAVLAAARRHLAGPRPAGFGVWDRVRLWFAWPVAAAASLALVGLIYFFAKPDRELAREDLNHDGQVDILDAFQLAREAQSGTKADQGRDLNGDGVVDQRDAEFIAAQAVKLEKGGRS